MTRKFLDDIKTEMLTVLPDNSTQAISPADIRGVLTDIIDSDKQDEGCLHSNTTSTMTLTGTFQLVLGYAFTLGDDGDFLNLDFVTGTVKGTSIAGFSYAVSAAISFNANREALEFVIARAGVPVGFIALVEGAGTNDDVTSRSRYFEHSAPANAEYTLMARAVDGAATLNINEVQLSLVIVPTNNP